MEEDLRLAVRQKDAWMSVLLDHLLPACPTQRQAVVAALQDTASSSVTSNTYQLSTLVTAVLSDPPAKKLVTEVEVRRAGVAGEPPPSPVAWPPHRA